MHYSTEPNDAYRVGYDEETIPVSFGHNAFCRQLSVACVGRKPLGEIHVRSRTTAAVT